ncbi:hypothetical protein IC006_1247 [Sulfuracidifex tepidarius]|uniref:Uncharacterized protein n=1 Tax=Sulfuracidifex tepidarius TaxID=1294262 RepID=A0A510DUU7_9CREN|nr:hypothetical protein IC006_1247 [Sulfuracidifex tepidarius]BBG26704.1 hypothetical protein IC007_1222 [Sulfuracidifex tepidarius]
MPYLDAEAYIGCIDIECDGNPYEIVTDNLECGYVCAGEAAAISACEIFC